LEKGILAAVKFKRWDTVFSAEIDIESRCGLHPSPFQIKLHETVVDKEVAPHELKELLCGKMIPDIRKTHASGESAGSSQGAKKRSLGHAEASAPFQHITCAIMFREIKGRIGVVDNIVAYGKVKLHGDLNRVLTPPGDGDCVISNGRMIAIDHRCWT
jgi:hypothetical protein